MSSTSLFRIVFWDAPDLPADLIYPPVWHKTSDERALSSDVLDHLTRCPPSGRKKKSSERNMTGRMNLCNSLLSFPGGVERAILPSVEQDT